MTMYGYAFLLRAYIRDYATPPKGPECPPSSQSLKTLNPRDLRLGLAIGFWSQSEAVMLTGRKHLSDKALGTRCACRTTYNAIYSMSPGTGSENVVLGQFNPNSTFAVATRSLTNLSRLPAYSPVIWPCRVLATSKISYL